MNSSIFFFLRTPSSTKVKHTACSKFVLKSNVFNCARSLSCTKKYSSSTSFLNHVRIHGNDSELIIGQKSERIITSQKYHYQSSLKGSSNFFLTSLGPPRRSIGNTTQSKLLFSSDSNAQIKDGEYYYQKALEAIQKSEQLEKEIEEKQANEQYEAMRKVLDKQQARNHGDFMVTHHKKNQTDEDNSSIKSRAAGVALVKTISKQTNLNKKKKDNGSRVNKINKLKKDTPKKKKTPEDYLTESRKLLEEAALKFAHPKALVKLGNQFLSDAEYYDKNETDETMREFSSSIFCHYNDTMTSMITETVTNLLHHPVEKALYLYISAGHQGESKEGWYNAAHLLWSGFSSSDDDDDTFLYKPNQNLAIEYFTNAMDLGDVDAMYFLGVQYYNQGDARKGIELIQKASESGHTGADYYLSLIYLNGDEELNIENDLQKFQLYLNNACEPSSSSNNNTPNPDALNLRANCHYFGSEGYPKSNSKALQDYKAAAQYGHGEAACSAGAMLFNSSLEDSKQEAFEYYQLSAELGCQEGWRNVVRCYALGEGVQRNVDTAKYIANLMLDKEEEK